ncbi:MAG: glycosyltransferase family 39 protein [Anaerolineae bacterium]
MTSSSIDSSRVAPAAAPVQAGQRSLSATLTWLAPISITFLGFVLRVLWLDRQGLWVDESLTLGRTSWVFARLWTDLPLEHVPLYFMVANLFTKVAGDGDFALRFPSVVAGVVAIPLIYQLSRRLFGVAVALVAALFLAVNPFQVWYSQDARMYPQLVALSLATLLALDVALDGEVSRRQQIFAWTAYVVASAATFYTQYYGVLTLIIAAVYGILRLATMHPRSRSPWLRFIGAEVAIGVLLLPYLPRVLRFVHFVSHHDPAPIGAAEFARLFNFGTTMPPSTATWLGVAGLVLYGLGILALAINARSGGAWRPVLFVGSVVAVFVALVLALNARESYYHIRYFVVVGALLIPLAALGVVTLSRWTPALSVLGVVLVVAGSVYSLNLWYTNVDYAKSRHKDYVQYVLEHAGPNDAFITLGANDLLARRYGAEQVATYLPLEEYKGLQKSEASTDQALTTITEGHPTVWYAHKAEGRDVYVKHWLDLHAFQTSVIDMDDFRVMEYGFPAPLPEPVPAAQAEGPLPLNVTWSSAPNPAPIGGTVYMALHWLPTATMPPNLKVSLRLYNSDDQQVLQIDRAPNDGASPTQDWHAGDDITDRYGIHLPTDLSPGQYTLRAILYDYATLEPQRKVTLGTLTIAP